MDAIIIKGEARGPGGRHANERIRRKGYIPAVIYGHKQDPEHVSLSLHDLDIALHKQAHVVELDLSGKKTQYFLKQVQYDHLQRTPMHVDLMRVDVNERVKLKVPIELRGTPEGVKEGGAIVQPVADLEIECLLIKIPDAIRVEIAHLKMNQVIHVRELALPEGVKALNNPEDVVVSVRPPRSDTPVVAVAGEEGAAEPEVIAKGKLPGEGEEGAAPPADKKK